MATIDLRTLPISVQHHSLAFNPLGRTGREASDFLWICPICDDGQTHQAMSWSGGTGYYHFTGGSDFDEDLDERMHQLVAVDVLAVLEQWRQIGFTVRDHVTVIDLGHMLALGAPREDVTA